MPEIVIDFEDQTITLTNQPPIGINSHEAAILRYLIENKKKKIAADELGKIGWPHDKTLPIGRVNRLISALRKKLGDITTEPKFIKTFSKEYEKNKTEKTLKTGTFCFIGDVQRLEENRCEITSANYFTAAQMIFGHRSRTGYKYIKEALAQGQRIVWVTIMAEESYYKFEEFLEEISKEQVKTQREIFILTWMPEWDVSILPLQTLLNEEHLNSKRQVAKSWKHWEKLEKKYIKNPNIKLKVYQYRAFPSLQGLHVLEKHKKWVYIEVIPFGCEHKDRPSIYFTEVSNPTGYKVFSEALEKLLNHAEKTIPLSKPKEAILKT